MARGVAAARVSAEAPEADSVPPWVGRARAAAAAVVVTTTRFLVAAFVVADDDEDDARGAATEPPSMTAVDDMRTRSCV